MTLMSMHNCFLNPVLAEEYKWLNILRVLLGLCYFLFLELFGLLSVVRMRDWAKALYKA